MEFYDIHSHILAKVDDGAETFEMSCRMLDMAYEEGIRHLCVTPHYNRHNADDAERPKKVMRAFRALELYAKKQYEDMHLYRGNEVMYFPDMVKYLDSGSITTMNGGRYVLVEYKPNASYHNVYSGLQQILYGGYLPVLAHVERLDCLIDEWDKLEELKGRGVILQMNTDGLIGGRFDRWVRRCRVLVEDGYIDVLGTDAHNMTSRPPQYRKAAEWIEKKCGRARLRQLAEENPRAILENRLISST